MLFFELTKEEVWPLEFVTFRWDKWTVDMLAKYYG